jgi:hypothetical protein
MKWMPLPLAKPLSQAGTSDRQKAPHNSPSSILEARWLRLWHLASLDAPTVAVIWSLAFAQAASIRLPSWVPTLLALGTWAVYVGDRLLDALAAIRSGDLSQLRERHYFHWHRRRALIPLAVSAAVIAAIIIFAVMPPQLRERDSALAVAALAYFSTVHLPHGQTIRRFRPVSKELLVGVLFTAGCALPTLSRLSAHATFDAQFWLLLVAIAVFALLAWLNCYAIEQWESRASSRIFVSACIVGLVSLLFALVAYHVAPNVSALLIAGSTSAFLFALFDSFRDGLSPLSLRIAADLFLLTPMFLLLR